jgi:hypothetical protein
MREYNESGDLKDPAQLLAEKGFKVDMHVHRTKDKLAGKITDISPEHVTIITKDNVKKIINFTEFMSNVWHTVAAKKDQAGELDGWWPSHSHTESAQMKCMIAHAKLVTAVNTLVNQKSKNWVSSCSIFLKPRSIKAKKALDAEELMLVPSSLSMTAIVDDGKAKAKIDKVAKAALFLSSALTVGTTTVHMVIANTHIAPPKPDEDDDDKKDKQGFIVPFWEVQPTEKASEANMTFRWITHSSISLPVLVNENAVSAGKELKYLASTWPGKPKAVATPETNPDGAEAQSDVQKRGPHDTAPDNHKKAKRH